MENPLEYDPEEPQGETLIRSYGLYWSRDAVDWDHEKLHGERRKYKKTSKNKTSKIKACDAWRQRGIYALYSDFKLVYVGMANSSSEGIGSRLLSHHTKPRMHGRWDSFSWFGIDAYDVDARLVPYSGAQAARPIAAPTIVRTLELVSILVANPPMNRSEGKFKGAEQIVQDTSYAAKSVAQNVESLFSEIVELKASIKKLSK